jgi:HPt (histidine-containing phosphotransfer) domain-containing protein
LRSYLEELATQPDQIALFLQQGDLASAARLLHTCKGLSASVGAVYMSAIARHAESALKDKPLRTRPDGWLANFREAAAGTARAMGPLVQEFAAATEPATATTSGAFARLPGARDPAALLADLGELQTLLASSDLRALELHARIHSRPPQAAPLFAELDAAVRDFDFVAGAAHCAQLISVLGGGQAAG